MLCWIFFSSLIYILSSNIDAKQKFFYQEKFKDILMQESCIYVFLQNRYFAFRILAVVQMIGC